MNLPPSSSCCWCWLLMRLLGPMICWYSSLPPDVVQNILKLLSSIINNDKIHFILAVQINTKTSAPVTVTWTPRSLIKSSKCWYKVLSCSNWLGSTVTPPSSLSQVINMSWKCYMTDCQHLILITRPFIINKFQSVYPAALTGTKIELCPPNSRNKENTLNN